MYLFLLLAFPLFCPAQEPCIDQAALETQFDCWQLTEEQKGALAFQMAQCHYRRSARKTIECDSRTQPIKECTRSMDPHQWNIFTQFYVLVQHYCQIQSLQYLSDQSLNQLELVEFQQNKIHSSAVSLAQLLEQLLAMQDQLGYHSSNVLQLLRHHQNTLQESQMAEHSQQARMLDSLTQINQQITDYHTQITQSFQDIFSFYATAKSYMESLLSHSLGLQIQTIYAAVSMIVWLSTGSPKLARTRSLCIIVLCASYYSSFKLGAFQYHLIGLTVLVVCVILIYSYAAYRDYEQMTYLKLMSIEKDLQHFDLRVLEAKLPKVIKSHSPKKLAQSTA